MFAVLLALTTLAQPVGNLECNLGARDLQTRMHDVRALIGASVTEVTRSKPGSARLSVRIEAVTKMMEMVLAERRCCTGVKFVWTITGAQTPVYLEVRAPAEMLDGVFGSVQFEKRPQ